MAEFSIDSNSVDQTRDIGRAMAMCMRSGDVVALIGDLGAGKTHLVQSIATELGADPDSVNSPTFVLIQEYDTRIPICHIDTYRLANSDEFLELGADELMGSDCICLIEWADRVEDVLPSKRIEIRIETTGASQRRLKVSASTAQLAAFEDQLNRYGISVILNG